MRTPFKRLSLLAGLGLIAAICTMPASVEAQINSNSQAVDLVATTIEESITLTVSPSIVNFTLSAFAPALGDAPVVTQIDYSFDPNGGSRDINLYYYFEGTDALVNNGSAITTDLVSGIIDAMEYPFTAPVPFAGSGATGLQFPLVVQTGTASTSVSMQMKLDTTSLPLIPGAYVGTMFVQAQAF